MNITVYVPKDLEDELKRRAESAQLTPSRFIQAVLRDALSAQVRRLNTWDRPYPPPSMNRLSAPPTPPRTPPVSESLGPFLGRSPRCFPTQSRQTGLRSPRLLPCRSR